MKTLRPGLIVVVLATVCLSGCVRWSASRSLGQAQEVMVTPLGEPYLQETTQANLFGASRSATRGNRSGTNVAGAFSSVRETRCVQRAEILYAQPVTTTYREDKSGGWLLSGGAILLGSGLFIAALVQDWSYEEDVDFANSSGDPDFFDPGDPPETEGLKLAGGAIAITGLGIAVMTGQSTPDEPRPADIREERSWTETAVIDAKGCRSAGIGDDR